MINLSVHTRLLRRRATTPFSGRLLPGVLITGSVLAAALMGMPFRTPQSGSIDEAVAVKAFVDSSATMKIVPADVHEKNLSWSHLTGDGSN